MMSPGAVEQIRKNETNKARRQKLQPNAVRLNYAAIKEPGRRVGQFNANQRIPFLGRYVHPDWYLEAMVLADKMGHGDSGMSYSTNELAEWSCESKVGKVKDGTVGLGIIEESQFQVVIGRYVKGTKPADFTPECGVGIWPESANRW